MGKIDPTRRTVPVVTATTEDWLWFQLAMIDEEDSQGATGLGGLRGFGEVLMGYGERHFDGPVGQKNSKRGVWTRVLLTCGMFERVSCEFLNLFFTNPCVGRGCSVRSPRPASGSCSLGAIPRLLWSPARLITSGILRRGYQFVVFPLPPTFFSKLIHSYSDYLGHWGSFDQFPPPDLPLHPTVHEDRSKGSLTIRLHHLLERRPSSRRGWEGASRGSLGDGKEDYRFQCRDGWQLGRPGRRLPS